MTKQLSYEDWKTEFDLSEKEHTCNACMGVGKALHFECAGEGCKDCSTGVGCDHCDGDGCSQCGRGFMVCNVCKGYGHMLHFIYERMRTREIELLRKWNGVGVKND